MPDAGVRVTLYVCPDCGGNPQQTPLVPGVGSRARARGEHRWRCDCGFKGTFKPAQYVPESVVQQLERERDDWRKEAFDCWVHSGADTDGDGPQHLQLGWASKSCADAAQEYREACDEVAAAESRLSSLLTWLRSDAALHVLIDHIGLDPIAHGRIIRARDALLSEEAKRQCLDCDVTHDRSVHTTDTEEHHLTGTSRPIAQPGDDGQEIGSEGP